MMNPSFERDAVRLCGLRRRADLNDCYGLVQTKRGPDAYEVRIGKQSVLVKMANLVFVGYVPLVFNADGVTDDMRKYGLVLDSAMRQKYLGDC